MSFYLILTAIQFQFSMPLLGFCLLKLINLFVILKEMNITENSELLSFNFPKVQMYNMSKLPRNHFISSYITFT